MTNKQRIQVVLSYLRVLLATGLSAIGYAFVSGNHNAYELAVAGVAAIVTAALPPLMRWLNPNDKIYGRGAAEPTKTIKRKTK